MIQINLQFETGAEARKALEELLGSSTQIVEHHIKGAIENEKIAENFAAPETQVSEVETPVKKRRIKAELALENAAPAIEKELVPEGGDIQDDGINPETDPAKEGSKAITADMLKEKAVELIRNNKKPEVTALVKSFGADSVATADKNPIKPEDYVRFMDELNKL